MIMPAKIWLYVLTMVQTDVSVPQWMAGAHGRVQLSAVRGFAVR